VAGDSRWVVSAAQEQQALDRVLRELIGGESWNKVRRWIETGKVRVNGDVVVDPRRPVRAEQIVELSLRAPRPRSEPMPASTLVYVDAHVVVVHKPAGLSTVPYDATEIVTLDRLTADLLATRERARRAPLGIVHRLDKETTGLVVFARTLPAKRELKNQFRFHTVQRRYWAIVHGILDDRTLSSRLVQDRGDGLRGSTQNPKLGRAATTHVTALRRYRDATLVECRLETGRTHQIRIHLAEAGHPLLGERVYVRQYRSPLLPAPRVMLHAFELGFAHPVTGAPLSFASEMPEDMTRILSTLTPAAALGPRTVPTPRSR
jgi:23S rRNA pseudouridine1911/1915/1917 synthase